MWACTRIRVRCEKCRPVVRRGRKASGLLAFTAVAVLGLLAAAGPSLFGVLHDATDAWTIPLGLHLAITLCLMIDIVNEINT